MADIVLSVCIVNYQARDYLRECLDSIRKNVCLEGLEIIVVDNGSQDQSIEMLSQDYPEVRLIRNEKNEGYTLPMNQGLKAAVGRYLMQLNPDTIILPGAFEAMVSFMDAHPEVGISGPKVLNTDGSMQKSCRRGDSRPLAVFAYFLGLARRFPKSKLFGGYHLNYLDEDEINEVGGLAGSCMLIRRDVIQQIGYLDEAFFAYQEDADFCFRARQAGWKVTYYPVAKIIHYGGQGGSRVQPYKAIIEWHRSYWIYYRKNFAKDYFFLFNWFYYTVIALKLLLAIMVNFFRKEKYAGPRRPRS